jgi:N6-L-threonylcarbamoyladenine synthase
VKLGLPFPAGPGLDRLARRSEKRFTVKPAVKGPDCSLSGIENQCADRQARGETPEDISRFCLESLIEALSLLAGRAREQYGALPLLFSGGVASNSLLREEMEARYGTLFAPPAFSQDNAAGSALLCYWKMIGL